MQLPSGPRDWTPTLRRLGWTIYTFSFYLPAARFVHTEGISPKGPLLGFECAILGLRVLKDVPHGGFPWLLFAGLASLSNFVLWAALIRRSKPIAFASLIFWACSIPALIGTETVPLVGFYTWAAGFALLVFFG
jgi:hypothetical protein